MNKARVRINGLASLVYWEDEVGFDQTALVVPGLPYETSESPFVQLLAPASFGVIQPQYMGTFDSEGEFSPESAVETLLRFQDVLRNNSELYDLRAERSFRVGNQINVLVAHSFGTYAAIGAILQGLRTPIAIMCSPMFEFGSRCQDVGIKVDMERHVRHISNALPLTFRLKSQEVWHDFFTTREKFHPEREEVTCPHRTKLLIIAGDSDPSLDVKRSQQYVKGFISHYSHCLELADYLVVNGGNHDLLSLLNSNVVKAVKRVLAD